MNEQELKIANKLDDLCVGFHTVKYDKTWVSVSVYSSADIQSTNSYLNNYLPELNMAIQYSPCGTESFGLIHRPNFDKHWPYEI